MSEEEAWAHVADRQRRRWQVRHLSLLEAAQAELAAESPEKLVTDSGLVSQSQAKRKAANGPFNHSTTSTPGRQRSTSPSSSLHP